MVPTKSYPCTRVHSVFPSGREFGPDVPSREEGPIRRRTFGPPVEPRHHRTLKTVVFPSDFVLDLSPPEDWCTNLLEGGRLGSRDWMGDERGQ